MLLTWSQNTILGIILPKTHINGIKRLKLYYPYFLALTVSNLTWKPAIKESYDILESSWNACFRDLNRNYPHLIPFLVILASVSCCRHLPYSFWPYWKSQLSPQLSGESEDFCHIFAIFSNHDSRRLRLIEDTESADTV